MFYKQLLTIERAAPTCMTSFNVAGRSWYEHLIALCCTVVELLLIVDPMKSICFISLLYFLAVFFTHEGTVAEKRSVWGWLSAV